MRRGDFMQATIYQFTHLHFTLLSWIAIITILLLMLLVIWLRVSPPYIINQRTLLIDAKASDVFSIVSDVKKQSLWRRDLNKVETSNNHASWCEVYKSGHEVVVHEERRKDWILGTSLYSNGKFVGFREIICINIEKKTKVLITETICYGRKSMWQIVNIFYKNGEHLDNYLQDLKTAITD